jgi:hypothetical protein
MASGIACLVAFLVRPREIVWHGADAVAVDLASMSQKTSIFASTLSNSIMFSNDQETLQGGEAMVVAFPLRTTPLARCK